MSIDTILNIGQRRTQDFSIDGEGELENKHVLGKHELENLVFTHYYGDQRCIWDFCALGHKRIFTPNFNF